VVSEILRRAHALTPDHLELVDLHLQLPQLAKRHGITDWPVLIEDETYQGLEEIPVPSQDHPEDFFVN
jgi:hypothetical protein